MDPGPSRSDRRVELQRIAADLKDLKERANSSGEVFLAFIIAAALDEARRSIRDAQQ